MNNKIKIAAFLLSACMGCTAVSAAGVYNVHYDLAEKNVTISGKATPLSHVTLELLQTGKTGEDLKNIDSEKADKVVSRYDQCKADDSGLFSFVFSIPSDVQTGSYVTRVAWGSGANENTLIYISPTDFENSLKAVNDAENVNEMIKAIDDGINYFGLENPYYKNFTSKEKNALAEYILSERPANGYENSVDFGAVFNPASAVQALSISSSGANAIEVMEYFDDILEFSNLKSYPTFAKQTEAVKKEIAENVVKSGACTDKKSAQEAFENKTVIYSLYRAAGYDAVYGILKDNNHLMNIDFSDYDSLSSKSSVDKKMTESLFSSAKAAADAFDSYVASAKKGSGSGGSSGGSGSGGGSSSSKKNNSSTISMPQVNTNVNINDNIDSTVEFTDIACVEWAREAIESLAEQKIVSGKGNNEYDPLAPVKREEFVTMLVSALKIHNADAKCSFTDVKEDAWYYTYVASAVSGGLVNGISENVFGAGEDISKEDIAALLYRAAELKGKVTGSENYIGFDDESDISGYALTGVKTLNSMGVINGNGSGSFEPKKSATRAETAVMLYRFLNKLN